MREFVDADAVMIKTALLAAAGEPTSFGELSAKEMPSSAVAENGVGNSAGSVSEGGKFNVPAKSQVPAVKSAKSVSGVQKSGLQVSGKSDANVSGKSGGKAEKQLAVTGVSQQLLWFTAVTFLVGVGAVGFASRRQRY
ncbi:LPXTG-motif cell wall anchor domain protein [Gleimia coleocanis DSM 15436]|uniref:LPXTG-motif cell wall anchor domain protein n=1 Tax=Gleimia coleocanis DSM 15436 TaxID=525245 RepID=C0W259_9ACTO|nr:hypothetical protein [Gleimia coleocanis]EEH63273.1 LPXTG-motif cell wall anchor domain protein [Gleimia coleocanis DSM 15436]